MSKKFKLEHIGITAERPVALGKWYRDNLGFEILFSSDEERDSDESVAFIRDASGACVIEIFKLRNIAPVHKMLNNDIQLHFAFESDDPIQDAEYLESKGAKFIEKCKNSLPGDILVILKDPWGNTIQLAKRKIPFLNM